LHCRWVTSLCIWLCPSWALEGPRRGGGLEEDEKELGFSILEDFSYGYLEDYLKGKELYFLGQRNFLSRFFCLNQLLYVLEFKSNLDG